MWTLLKIFAALAFLHVSLAGSNKGCKSSDNADDCTALRDLYKATNGTGIWPFSGWCQGQEEWMSGSSYCTWTGVTCDATGRVSELDLDGKCKSGGNNMIGPVPDSISLLTELTYLSFAGNPGLGEHGSIPDSIGQLNKLTGLNLGNCHFEILPASVGQLNKLTILVLSGNGFRSLPDSLGQLNKLTTLVINECPLGGGPIPAFIGNLTLLTELNLFGCGFQGALPDWISNLKVLPKLDLSYNQFTGSIPESWKQLKLLTDLNLSYNQITNIPDWIGELTELTSLQLQNNSLTGAVPDSIGQLTKVGVLELQNNELSGKFNTKICDLMGTNKLNTCLMGNNKFECPLPKCAEGNPPGYSTPYKDACILYGVDGGVCPPDDSIADLAVIMPEISTLFTALKAADLVDMLSGKGPFTVFAPTNKAFAALPNGTLANLLKPENKPQLVKVLTNHLTNGNMHSTDFNDGEKLKTLEGEEVTIRIFGDDPIGRVISIDSAKITGFETVASNGIVHFLDSVLLPTQYTIDGPLLGQCGDPCDNLDFSCGGECGICTPSKSVPPGYTGYCIGKAVE